MDFLDAVFVVAVIVMSAVIHEVMHGVAAEQLGDPTARLQGRITLNPISHLDPVGSVFLPIILVLTHAPLFFAWAKPVPYNPYNLRSGKFSEAIVAGAGPASNLAIAIVLGIFANLLPLSMAVKQELMVAVASWNGLSAASTMVETFYVLAFTFTLINIMLFFFNLIPIPPLDGSKVLASILPPSLAIFYDRLRAYLEWNPLLGFGAVILFIVFAGGAFSGFVWTVARVIAGA